MIENEKKKDDETTGQKICNIVLPIIVIIIGAIAVILILARYYKPTTKVETVISENSTEVRTEQFIVDYRYLDQFIDFLHTNSDVYNDASQEFLKNQYVVWYTNKGYSDIIIGIDGTLESTNDSMSTYDILPVYDEMPEGIYTWYGEGFSLIASIEYVNDDHSGGIINLTGYSSVGEQFNNTCETFWKTSNFDDNGGFYSCGPYINFKFNKDTQQLEVTDVTVTMYESLTNQPGVTPEEVQEVLDKWQISFDGKYDFIFPYAYEK